MNKREVVIVDAIRSPIGKYGGLLSYINESFTIYGGDE